MTEFLRDGRPWQVLGGLADELVEQAVSGPTEFLIDDERRLVHVFGSAGPLLTSRDGSATGDLLDQFDESLRVPLGGAIQRAFDRQERVEIDDVRLLGGPGEQHSRLVVTPMPDRFGAPAYAMVAVEADASVEQGSLDAVSMSRTPPLGVEADASVDAVFLERELQLTRETLRTTVEELVASNEELRSANEELQTVNSEYEEKVVELTELTRDLAGSFRIRGSDIGQSSATNQQADEGMTSFEELLDTFPEPVWVLDTDRRIRRVNAVARSLADVDPLMRRPVEAYGDGAAWMETEKIESDVERPFGTDGPRHLRVLTSSTEAGGRMVIGVDLTQLVEARRSAEERSEAMAHRNAELDQFAHMASHDLRAPIRAVRLLGQQAIAGDEDPIAFAHEAVSTADRMREIIDSLLAFADIGRHEVRFSPVDLTEIVDSVRLDLRAELDATGGAIEGSDLPTWPADPVLLRRAIMNLVHNALVHGGVDDPVVRIEAAQRGNDLLEIDITDNGRGIGAHGDVNVFDPFTRINAEHSGTGMGLAIARRVSLRHGGSIDIAQSGPDGTTFRLRLRSSEHDD